MRQAFGEHTVTDNGDGTYTHTFAPIDPEEVFWGLGEEYTMKKPMLYRTPEIGESVLVVHARKMPTLVGKVGRIVERPPDYIEPATQKPLEGVTASYQACMVALERNDDFEYRFRIGDLLYENMELPHQGEEHEEEEVRPS
jgi:hypothetical protein